ncbi:Circadian clock protein KaiC [Candidatus Magnetoovum chiemensis]|nr:Circadian clock protein KaiC [Candidatus Magnetoovum chiemensis]
MINYEGLEAPEKLPTGIEGFDHITMGGLPEGRTTLIVGSSGSGKTLLSVEFLYKSIIKYNRNGLLVTFEEKPKDIIRNVKRLGWNLPTLITEKRIAIIDVSMDPSYIHETGAYDLTGLISQVKYGIEKVKAKCLVMDSIGSLFYQFTNHAIIRSEISRMMEEIRQLGVTAVLTAERVEEYGTISKHGIEEFVSDNVIILRNVLEAEKCRRTIQVLKIRGDTHFQGESPFTFSHTGLSILPMSAMELTQSSSNVRISFGSKDLDKMANGGLFRDSIILVSGPTGGGKTLMCSTFAGEACRNKERVLILAYEESRQQLLRNAQAWGLDFLEWEKEGLLKIICIYPEAMGLVDHLLMIRREIDAFKPNRLVMDSISAMERVASVVRTFREFVIGLTSFVKHREICSLFTSTTPKLSGGDSITEAHISTITDAIILLRYVEISGALRRGIAIIKMRGSQHEKDIREFTIDSSGLHIGEPFKNVQNIILGIPSGVDSSEKDHLEDMFSK